MHEEWLGTWKNDYDKESLENERKLLHDVDLAHNISVNANPNE